MNEAIILFIQAILSEGKTKNNSLALLRKARQQLLSAWDDWLVVIDQPWDHTIKYEKIAKRLIAAAPIVMKMDNDPFFLKIARKIINDPAFKELASDSLEETDSNGEKAFAYEILVSGEDADEHINPHTLDLAKPRR